jgi:transposase
MDEQKKYEVIKVSLTIETQQTRAALSLAELCVMLTACSLVIDHWNDTSYTEKKVATSSTISDETKQLVIDHIVKNTMIKLYALYRILEKHEGISISASSVYKFLEAEYILSPKVTRANRNGSKNICGI